MRHRDGGVTCGGEAGVENPSLADRTRDIPHDSGQFERTVNGYLLGRQGKDMKLLVPFVVGEAVGRGDGGGVAVGRRSGGD